MIYTVDKKYCNVGRVQYSTLTDDNQLIVGPNGIMLLKLGDSVVINKYATDTSRSECLNGDLIQSDEDSFIELYDYNKVYMNFSGSTHSFVVRKNYFFKSNDGALAVDDVVLVDSEKNPEITSILSRAEIEAMFNSRAYDAMFVCNSFGMITFISSKADKISIGHNVIPTNKKIIDLDYSNRLWNYQLAKKLREDYLVEGSKRRPTHRAIDDIKELPLYGSTFDRDFTYMLITLKAGQFEIKWFKIDFVEKDKFRLTMSPVYLKEPTVDDVLHYREKSEFKPMPEIFERSRNNEQQGKHIKFQPVDGKK